MNILRLDVKADIQRLLVFEHHQLEAKRLHQIGVSASERVNLLADAGQIGERKITDRFLDQRERFLLGEVIDLEHARVDQKVMPKRDFLWQVGAR